MDLVSTVTNAVVVGAVGAILGVMVRGLRGEVRGDIASLRIEVRQDIAELRTEVRQDIAELRRELGDVRSDLTQVALVVGAHTKAERGR